MVLLTRRRGLALILVAGVLGLLATVATAFVTMAQLERRASRQRLYETKALLLARAGLEDALARLSKGQDADLTSTRYCGEDWDADGALGALEPAAEVYQPGQLDTTACPVHDALRPSFFCRNPADGKPALISSDARARGFSGRLAGDHSGGGNSYALKVEDESAKINVNGGFLDTGDRDQDGTQDYHDLHVASAPPGTGRGWNRELARILDNLGLQPEIGVPGLGTARIIPFRPIGGYPSIQAVNAVAGKDLSAYLTVRSWTDVRVVRPNAWVQPDTWCYSDLKKGRAALALEEGGRPPVNLNAAPRPVLIALVQGLKGIWYDQEQHGIWQFPVWLPCHITYELNPTMTSAIVTQCILRRDQSPFSSWSDFEAFCDTLAGPPPAPITGLQSSNLIDKRGGGNLAGADLLKANFNPNTQLNKHLPDQILWRWIDKSDLLAWSTEGNLGPTGAFRVSVSGRCVDGRGRLRAQCRLSAELEAFQPLRQTTQRDFVGEGTQFRPQFQDYLALAPTDPTGWYRACGAGASWKTWPASPEQGLAVVTYPCPPVAVAQGNAADFDGGLGLGTLEVREGSMGLPSTAPPNALKFLHHFDGGGWNAAVGNPLKRKDGPGDDKLPLSPGASVWPVPPAEPNTLYPDGMHAQMDRCPAYQALGNIPSDTSDIDLGGGAYASSNHGVLSYWVKRELWPNSSKQLDFVLATGTAPKTQTLVVARHYQCWGMVMENCDTVGGDDEHERMFRDTVWPLFYRPGTRHVLVTAFWDTDVDKDVEGKDLTYVVEGLGGPPQGYDVEPDGSYPVKYALAASLDIVRSGADCFVLGSFDCLADMIALERHEANQVIDELAICDFGDLAPKARMLADVWHLGRVRDGRYYKMNDGAFLSTPIRLLGGEPLRLLRASWTAYLPGEKRLEIGGNASPASGTPRQIDDTLKQARLEVDLLAEAATLASAPLQELSQGAYVGRRMPALRYRVRFLPTPTWSSAFRDNNPVLETPFFDDISFACQPESGPRILTWERP
jgi:hypothetical protein